MKNYIEKIVIKLHETFKQPVQSKSNMILLSFSIYIRPINYFSTEIASV